MFVVRLECKRSEERARVETLVGDHGALIRCLSLGANDFVLFQSDESEASLRKLLAPLPSVVAFMALETPYLLSAREILPERTQINLDGDLVLGGEEFVVMAGPCTVESETQVATIAKSVSASGARVLRGGAFKPRTSPFSFQGRGLEGLDILSNAGRQAGLLQVSEAMSEEDVSDVASTVDILQVGMRNALNYSLLDAIGRHPEKPTVLLKRGIGSTLDEFLAAADYILSRGNPNVILCLRGTIGLTSHSRAALDITDIPTLRRLSHLPIVVDPSHAAGRRDLVPAMAAAALVAGADGLLIEVHHDPDIAWVDGPQSLTLDGFDLLMHRLRVLAQAMGRWVYPGQVRESLTGHPMEDLGMEKPTSTSDADGSGMDKHEELQA